MRDEADRPGVAALLGFGAATVLGLGAVLLGVSRVSFTGLLVACFAIVAASLVMLGCGFAWTIDRLVDRFALRRGPLAAAATFIVTALGAWSVWFGLGSPSQGTLTEAVPTMVDPILAALVSLTALRRSERVAALAFGAAAALTLVVVAQRVAAVAPSYTP
jgi:hypothetical protein